MAASTDPTVQTKGSLKVGLQLEYNRTAYVVGGSPTAVPIIFGEVTYGPPSAPPPAWTNGTQYSSGNGQAFGAMGMVPRQGTNPLVYNQAGVCAVLSVSDMSTNSVVPGKTYAFTVGLFTRWIQLYARITGGPNGSTVLPGFGLWSLGTNPNAWTYVTAPEPFAGEWMIGLLSPASFAVMWLSAEYAPPKDYGSGQLESRLLFTCTGSRITDRVSGVSAPEPQAGAFLQEPDVPVGIQHLHARSRAHIVHPGSDVPVG